MPHTGVHRRTLRQILSGRLGDAMRIGAPVVSYVEDADGVTVTLADGSTARGDVLVGADGIRSAVRRQMQPEVPVIPTGIRGIGVYGRTLLTPELDEVLPHILDQGVLIAVDRKGSRLLVANFRPRQAADEAAAELAPDVRLDPVPSYAMISCSLTPGTEVPPAGEWTEQTALDLRDSMLAAIEGWHPAAHRARRRPGPGLDVRDPVRLPRAGRELGAVARDDHRRRGPRHAPDARHGRQPRAERRRRCSSTSSTGCGRGEAALTEAIGAYEAHDARDGVPDPADDPGPRQELRRRRAGRGRGTAGGGERAARRPVRARHGHRRRHRARDGADLRPRGRARGRLRPAPRPVSRRPSRLVRAAGGRMDAVAPVDLATEAGAQAWVDQAVALAGGVDVLVNNASAIRFGAIDQLSYDDWSFTIRNELDIVFLGDPGGVAAPGARGGGSIVNVALDLRDRRGAWFMPQNAHGAAKGGVLALTSQLVVEGGPHGIRVNAVSPAMTETPHTSPMLHGPGRPGRADPVPRAAGQVGAARGRRERDPVPRERRVVARDRGQHPGRRRSGGGRMRSVAGGCSCAARTATRRRGSAGSSTRAGPTGTRRPCSRSPTSTTSWPACGSPPSAAGRSASGPAGTRGRRGACATTPC